MSQVIGVLSFIGFILLVGYSGWILNRIPYPHDDMAFVAIIAIAVGLIIVGLAGIIGIFKK